MLVGILLVAANLRAAISAVGPLLSTVQADLGLEAASASGLIALPVLCFALVSPFVPRLGRRLGIERALVAALGLLAVSIVLRSMPTPTLLWVGTVGIGAALAVMNVLLPPLVKRDFADRVGFVTGLYSAVQSAVAAVASTAAVPIAGATEFGWRLAFGIWAGLALVAMGLALPLLQHRQKDNRLTETARSEVGPERLLRAPWRMAVGWQVTLFSGLQALLYYTVLAWWPTIELASGVEAAEAGLHQGLLQVVGIAASLGAAGLLHRGGTDARGAVLLFSVPSIVALAGQFLLPAGAILWVVLLGLGIGGTFVVSTSLFSLRTAHPTQTAQLSALAQTVGYSLAATGPFVAGMAADATGSWAMPLHALLVLQFAQLGIGLLASKPRKLM